jgi:NAD(P)H-hydrate epimerase
MNVFTAEQMRAFDRTAVEDYQVPSIVLMENAAMRVVELLELKFSPLAEKQVLILCGKGNNGGDGFAVARHLRGCGCNVTLVLSFEAGELTGDALVNFLAIQGKAGDAVTSLRIVSSGEDWGHADLIVDALLGTGFKGEIRQGPVLETLQKVHAILEEKPIPVVAIDVPSGVNADCGKAAPDALHADCTITFAAPKRGFFVRDGLAYSGELWVGSIGTLPAQMSSVPTGCTFLSPTLIAEKACSIKRPIDAHKGDAGRVMIIGGSVGMSGAPTLASRAALASGAGLCVSCVPDKVQPLVAAGCLEATTQGLHCDREGHCTPAAAEQLAENWDGMQAVALGPGLGRSDGALDFARRVVRECPQPLIIDADALYALRAIEADLHQRKAATILTPHPGEMAELLGISIQDIQHGRYAAVQSCASRYNAIVVLKGSYSLIGFPEAGQEAADIYINSTGNAGMATGGSGDVLTGILAGLLAQVRGIARDEGNGWPQAREATLLGVYLHGLAGDLAFAEKGNGLVANDIARYVPQAVREIATRHVSAPSRLQRIH